MISDGFGVTLASSVELFEPWDPLGTIPSVDLGDFWTVRTVRLALYDLQRTQIKLPATIWLSGLVLVPSGERSFLG